jgi:hypothetical protein
MGVGATFQPTLVAAQAQSYRKDRAIIISTRNVLRSLGGAVGLAIANTVLSNFYTSGLQNSASVIDAFTPEQLESLKRQIFSSQLTSTFSSGQVELLREVYMNALKKVFFFLIASISYCLASTVVVRDTGLEPIDGRT